MPTIKRYSNRKLYDVDARRYVTLEEIGQLVRSGEEVKVVDYATGADLTTTTLLQVLFEEQKRSSNFPPLALLTHLVNRGMQALTSTARNTEGDFEQELRLRIAALIEQTRLDSNDADRLLGMLLDPALTRTEPPASNADIQALQTEVERLEKRLAEISA